MTSHETLLDRYAELTITSGLGLKAGQQLLLTAPLEAVDLVRRITFHAYKAGASLVTTLYTDEQATLMRYEAGHDAGFDTAPAWLFNGMAEAFTRTALHSRADHLTRPNRKAEEDSGAGGSR